MDNIADKIDRLAKTLGKLNPNETEYISYQTLRSDYEAKANAADDRPLQRSGPGGCGAVAHLFMG